MKKNVHLIALAGIFYLFNTTNVTATDAAILLNQYTIASTQWSDMYEHVPVLRDLAKECSSVCEIGVRSMVATWGLLQGLTESTQPNRSYLGIDLDYPPSDSLNLANKIAQTLAIKFDFWAKDDTTIALQPTDLLFIDSLHTYCHLTYELETFAPQVTKYIVMHDTSAPWGEMDMDDIYFGDRSSYPEWIDRTKRGLWPAVEDFLSKHPEWVLHERRFNSHGLTILKRVT